MISEYAIISIDDSRQANKDSIRKTLTKMTEVELTYVNGQYDQQLIDSYRRWPFKIPRFNYQRGEWGIWFSNLNVWEYAADNNGVILLEDDAIVQPEFEDNLKGYLSRAPEDMDFLALWTPDNQRKDYLYNVTFNSVGYPTVRGRVAPGKSVFDFGHPYLTKAYQGYGGVAFYITKRGGQQLIAGAKERGFYTTSDCFYFTEAHRGAINGYSLKPEFLNLVSYDWKTPTTIHHTPKIDLTTLV